MKKPASHACESMTNSSGLTIFRAHVGLIKLNDGTSSYEVAKQRIWVAANLLPPCPKRTQIFRRFDRISRGFGSSPKQSFAKNWIACVLRSAGRIQGE